MPGSTVPRSWLYNPTMDAPPRYRRACRYDAFVPDRLAGLEVRLSAETAGVVSEAGIRAGFASVDKNGTGRVCAKVSNGLQTSNKPNGQYLLNIVDDNSSVR